MFGKKKKSHVYISPMDDLVFEDRNRNYGAYQHRIQYYGFVRRAFIITIFVTLGILVLPGIIRSIFWHRDQTVALSIPVNTSDANLTTPPKLPEPPAKDKSNTAINHYIKGKDSKSGKDTIAEKLKRDTLDASKDTALAIDTSGPERMPMYPGGNRLIADFVKTHLQYPWAEKESGIQGIAEVTFTVNEDGTLDDIETTGQVSIGINHEAERLISIMPKWWSAKHLNKPLKTRVKVAIEFKLASGS